MADSLTHYLNTVRDISDSLKVELHLQIAFHSTTPDKIIQHAETAYYLAKNSGTPLNLAKSLRYLGEGKQLKGSLGEAIEHYLASAVQFEKANYKLGVAVVYLNLGGIYSIQGNFLNSKDYFDRSVSILRKENDSIRLASALLNTGELYREFGKLDSAILLFEESGEIFQDIGYPVGTAYNKGNIGMVFEQQGDYPLAEENLLESIKVLTEYGDHYAIASYQVALSKVYQSKNNLPQAMQMASSAYEIGKQEGLKEQIRDASMQLSKLHRHKKDFQKAFEFQSQYIAYRDSINNEETIRKMADLRTEFEVGQKQVEVDLLNSQARTQRIILIAVSIVLVLVFVLAYVLYKLYKLRDRAIKISRERRRVIVSQRDRLAELNHTKDRFFSIISHDIRGPVNNFHGVAQLIKLYVESGETEELIAISKMMDKSSTELSTLLDNLLDWAMNQQGRFPYKPETLDLSYICNINLTMMEHMAAAKEIGLTEEVSGDIKIYADLNSVSTIIRNLLSNALKFTKKGGIVNLAIDDNGAMGIITVTDTGVGIPEEKMETLFGFKADRNRWGTSGEKGVGLGLNLVKEFVDMNNGKVEVSSEEGVGTTFRVSFPLVKLD